MNSNFGPALPCFVKLPPMKSDRSLFSEALEQFYNGEPDPRTLELLRFEQSKGSTM